MWTNWQNVAIPEQLCTVKNNVTAAIVFILFLQMDINYLVSHNQDIQDRVYLVGSIWSHFIFYMFCYASYIPNK